MHMYLPYLPVVVFVFGAVVYVASDKPKVTEIGRIMFWTGLLAYLLSFTR